jgi:aerobic carbon-monoxide dehydrogenase small subunit
MIITFTLNGRVVRADAAPDARALDYLREEALLTGVKEGCGAGDCGACAVLVDGRAKLSCLTLMAQLEGRDVVTAEGLAADGARHPLRQAFIDHGAVQCGYCSPGMLTAAADLLDRNPNPSRAEIRQGLSGNLCRCGGYDKITDAVQAVAKALCEDGEP